MPKLIRLYIVNVLIGFAGLIIGTLALIIDLRASNNWYISVGWLVIFGLFTAFMVIFFGGLTAWFNDERFFKMKPTMIYLLFAGVLGHGKHRVVHAPVPGQLVHVRQRPDMPFAVPQQFAAGGAVVFVHHQDRQVAGHLVAVCGRVEERVQDDRADHHHDGIAVQQHRQQGLPQAGPDPAHAPAPAGCAACVLRAKASRRQPPSPPARMIISSSVPSGHSDTASGAPTNCCWVCSLM